MNDFLTYNFLKVTVGVICTIGLYTVLYRESKFYRFFEHLFLGLAVGFAIVALWTETMKDLWWDKMVGTQPDVQGGLGTPGYWAYVLLIPIGIMGYFVFSKKHNWMSRIPIGIILGLWAGQQPKAWWTRYSPQMQSTLRPIFPTTNTLFHPSTAQFNPSIPADKLAIDRIDHQVYWSQAITNLIFVFTVVAVLCYFLFSFDFKSKIMKFMTTSGRWLLMIGFGAIFGSTVMMRFTLLIDRMYFVWIEWLKHLVLHIPG
ncbi:MAG TPA: hypothetical protein VHE55_18415 [Fimbriimonadaceae bacterium]|nr:hypothetical protein [Fimbriimonadaceae bacterium]